MIRALRRARPRPIRRLLVAALVVVGVNASAGSAPGCVAPPERDAQTQDRFFQWAERVRRDLDAAGAEVALIARAGMDLERLGVRYTHAALAWRDHPAGTWAVRQLYFDCTEQRPRLFDQGLTAFLMGGDGVDSGYLLALPLQGEPALALQRFVQDRDRALALLAARYQANARLADEAAQNCNQWVAEVLAATWSGGDGAGRTVAHDWMRAQGWESGAVTLPNRLWLWAAALTRHLGWTGQTESDLASNQMRVTLPEDLARWWRHQWPQASRLEWCLGAGGIGVHQGWARSWPQGCEVEGP
ncbi:DUF2145 domain-containing protein [Inhella gelatinilytica]|uniref:DUF2145 domain-containing protein n=1 Tax=Inhella gelatinilytica TaxID=2795030 RepID=A0A931NDR0_9BURK|nr:DUF2145 domain-containing protein [Inhella gelatinilytica]MBH9552889.1 DUF2145 domain-containing protein [Inhella gelatinilytica]